MTQRFFIIKHEPQSIESLPLVGRTSTRCDGALTIEENKMLATASYAKNMTTVRQEVDYGADNLTDAIRFAESDGIRRGRYLLSVHYNGRHYQPLNKGEWYDTTGINCS